MASDDAEAQEAREVAEEDLKIFETLCISSPRKVNRWAAHLTIPSLTTPVAVTLHAYSREHTHARRRTRAETQPSARVRVYPRSPQEPRSHTRSPRGLPLFLFLSLSESKKTNPKS